MTFGFSGQFQHIHGGIGPIVESEVPGLLVWLNPKDECGNHHTTKEWGGDEDVDGKFQMSDQRAIV